MTAAAISSAPLAAMPAQVARAIETVFCDIDDTMTTDGQIPRAAFDALWDAHEAGLSVVPVTGRPAGWCDHIARMWPVPAVVGENGALAFAMIDGAMQRIWADRPPGAATRLDAIRDEVLQLVPGAAVAADQAYRAYDLAIDFCEDVPPLDDDAIDRIVAVFVAHGATAKVSSIHVNGWFGDFDKLSMCRRASADLLGSPVDVERATFIGDSPNDVPMFAAFPHAIGVANVAEMAARMSAHPAYITPSRGGGGFAEAIAHVLDARRRTGRLTTTRA